jgi:hypothetical protein
MKLVMLIAFVTFSSFAFASPYANAVKQALAEFKEATPKDAAKVMFTHGDYRFIFVGGYSISAPGDFQLGADSIFKKFKSSFIPTDDTPSSDEKQVFDQAYSFAKDFNEEMLYRLIEAGLLKIFEVEFKVKDDVRLSISYSSHENITLRYATGISRVVWVEKISDIKVESGKLEIIRTEILKKKTEPNQSLQTRYMLVTRRATHAPRQACICLI